MSEAAHESGTAINYFEFRGVCKAFDDRPVLKDVSFTVKRGETCVIMGRSGVGKSVSLKHIMGFLKADSGQILVDGIEGSVACSLHVQDTIPEIARVDRNPEPLLRGARRAYVAEGPRSSRHA